MKRQKTEHRRIWRQHYGPIPKDSDGRTYEIHHIDGDHTNNDITNLIALTIHEHYEIHFWQEDMGACFAIGSRMKMSPEELSDIARRAGSESYKTQIERGSFRLSDPDFARYHANKRVKNGTHNWQDKDAASARELKKVSQGTHNFITNHPNKDHTVYTWENISTGKRVYLTQREFVLKFGASQGNVSTVARNNSKRKIVAGHRIITTLEE